MKYNEANMRKNPYQLFKIVSLGIFVFFNIINLSAQSASSKKTQYNIDLKQISLTNWDVKEGIPYRQVPGANLGSVSFELTDNNHIAFLCNSSNEIITINRSDEKVVSKIKLPFSPRDFIYSRGYYYVLSEYQVYQYDQKGKEINTFPFPQSYRGVERLIRFNNSTYLWLPSGKSLLIEFNGHSVEPREIDGWITSSGILVGTKLNGNTYSINITGGNFNPNESVFVCDKKVAGVYVVGSNENKLVLDVQTFVSENPVSVERNIVVIKLNNNGPKIITARKRVPDCYYVLSNKDFLLNKDGTILNMITSPEGVYVFNLTETSSGNVRDYPAILTSQKYHFNDHLIKNE